MVEESREERGKDKENLERCGTRVGELRRLIYFSFLEISATSFSSSSFDVTSHGPTLFASRFHV